MIVDRRAYLSNADVVVIVAVVVHNPRLKRIEGGRERWQLEIQFVGRASKKIIIPPPSKREVPEAEHIPGTKKEREK